MACECEFPAEVPFKCAKEAFNLIRSGGNLSEILQHVGCATGSCGKLLEGWSAPFGTEEAELPKTVEECLQQIEEESKAEGFGSIMLNILIQRLVELLLKELTEYLKG